MLAGKISMFKYLPDNFWDRVVTVVHGGGVVLSWLQPNTFAENSCRRGRSCSCWTGTDSSASRISTTYGHKVSRIQLPKFSRVHFYKASKDQVTSLAWHRCNGHKVGTTQVSWSQGQHTTGVMVTRSAWISLKVTMSAYYRCKDHKVYV